MSDQTPFTSVNEGSDHPKYRIGGFQTEVPNNQAALQGEFNLGTNPTSDSNANVNANEGPSETPSTTEPTADEKSEQDQEREQRERRFKELMDSGIINLNQKDAKPGRQYTLPVVKPKLQ
ncbi:hypothetical protein BGZ80_004797 [Entomortierella chlamydospora]|uniref:Uncharacterized protein n=1 Tax=Entomortierella chlamydospora TaxID=101097 RepID=A0A9P6MLP1_9FUNG|nr:hypothetical protein BGZ79_010842 [Entomortierella chlamydospora]KAG0007335.1 hypothetical protein BGZ80_004797 [Entomortierella chlamydospora]